MSPKIIYRGFSFLQFFHMLALRCIVLAALIYIAFQFNENPVLISILIILGTLLWLFVGDDQICVFSDRVIQTDTSLATILFNLKEVSYDIKNIKSAYLTPKSSDKGELAVALLFTWLLPKTSSTSERPIFFTMKDGSTIKITTLLDYNEKEKIVNTVNSLV